MFVDIESIFLAYKIIKRTFLLIFTRIWTDGLETVDRIKWTARKYCIRTETT